MKMKKYFKPNEIKQTKEEIQQIFRMRTKMTELKMNYKGSYDSFECSACSLEEESQAHIFKCKEILKHIEEVHEVPEYDRIFEGNVTEQVKIARNFKRLMRIKEKLNKES